MATMTATTSDIRSEIRRMNDLFEKIYAQGDAAGMATLYTENGMLLPPGTDVVRGHDGIKTFWQAVMNMGIKQAKLVTVEVDQLGDAAIEQGQYLLSGADGQTMDQGKYIVVWKISNGQWKLHQDIWNTSLGS